MVVFTAGVGYAMATPGGIDWTRLGLTLFGTFLAAAGANALNQWVEVSRDARMRRTCGRPLPTRRLTEAAALKFGLTAGLGGPLLLASVVEPLAGLLALAALVIYVLAYTPLKVRTPLNTLVGAVVGALPPLVGWAAAAGRLEAGAWSLAGILFAWQVPHFLALAWLYREDYARSGFRMLPVVDPAGHLTACVAVVYTLLLLPVALVLTLVGTCGWMYAAGSLALGGLFLAASIALERRRSERAARRLFVASLIYLPLLLGLMLCDRPGTATGAGQPVARQELHSVAPAEYVARSAEASVEPT